MQETGVESTAAPRGRGEGQAKRKPRTCTRHVSADTHLLNPGVETLPVTYRLRLLTRQLKACNNSCMQETMVENSTAPKPEEGRGEGKGKSDVLDTHLLNPGKEPPPNPTWPHCSLPASQPHAPPMSPPAHDNVHGTHADGQGI